MKINVDHINYLQRLSAENDFSKSDIVDFDEFIKDGIQFLKIKTIGKLGNNSEKEKPEETTQFPSYNIFSAAYELSIPLVFAIINRNSKAELYLGTGVFDKMKVENVKSNLKSLKSFISTICHNNTSISTIEGLKLENFSKASMVTGIPTINPEVLYQNSTPVDILLNSLWIKDWAVLILCRPVNKNSVNDLRLDLLIELNSVREETADSKKSSYVEYYEELLKQKLSSTSNALLSGLWRTGVYLLSDENSLHTLNGVWKSLYTGNKNCSEPIRIYQDNSIIEFSAQYKLPLTPNPEGPGSVHHVYKYQSLLNSEELSRYIHLPVIEHNGIDIKNIVFFNVIPHEVRTEESAIILGTIVLPKDMLSNSKEDDKNVVSKETSDINSSIPYKVSIKDLESHCLICGTTGSGKTTTIFYMLTEAFKQGVNFLVIESAKSEYRELLTHEIFKGKLNVFTLGNELVSPLRLNPFEILPGASVNSHIDLLKSVFTASFGMWSPLPQVLERCLHEIYYDKGWDLTENDNQRWYDANGDIVNELRYMAYPTLTDLYNKVDEVISDLGYEDKIRDDMRAALMTRLDSLRGAGKGKMLDIQKSTSFETIFNSSTIFELEGIGDDDDKAFIIGILYIFLYEFRRTQNEKERKSNLLVIEEAHRLLANVTSNNSPEEGNPKKKSVETFNNILAEIRKYKQGVIIADQIPTKLAGEIIKNTNLKIAHRIISKDDKEVLAASMLLKNDHVDFISTLAHRAIVFGKNDDGPLLLDISNIKANPISREVNVDIPGEVKSNRNDFYIPNDEDVKKIMIGKGKFIDPNLNILPSKQQNQFESTFKELFKIQVIKNCFLRFILSITTYTTEYPLDFFNSLNKKFDEYNSSFEKDIFNKFMWLKLSEWFIKYWSQKNQWSFIETHKINQLLNDLIKLHFYDKSVESTAEDSRSVESIVEEFSILMISLHTKKVKPYAACETICKINSKACLYRNFVSYFIKNDNKDFLGLKDLKDKKFNAIIEAKSEDELNLQINNLLSAAMEKTGTIIDSIYSYTREVTLCLNQHQIKNDSLKDQKEDFEQYFNLKF